METDLHATDAGYSPALSAELILHGERFDVISLGRDTVAIRSPRALEPGVGEIRMTVDGRMFVYFVEFPGGIVAEQQDQNFEMVRAAVAAA